MHSLVIDTNILLDIFVFDDPRAAPLKQALLGKQLQAFASQKTLAELADVLSRPLFSLASVKQEEIIAQWTSLANSVDDSSLPTAPWKCHDADDQVFLDMAYSLKPCILMSKDKQVLKIAAKAMKEGIVITSDYMAFNQIFSH